jgi:protein-arginine kinase activator protein McsA
MHYFSGKGCSESLESMHYCIGILSKSAKNPKVYRTRHQAEYQLHDSLKKELQNLGVTRIPSSKKIQERIENLESEQAAAIREKQDLLKKQKTLAIIQQNFSALLDTPNINSDLFQPKHESTSVSIDK